MKLTVTLFAALAALSLSGCGQTDNRQADIQLLKDNEARWNQEYAAKDLEKIVAHYSPDEVVMAPGMPPSSGADGIRKTLSAMVADQALTLHFEAANVEVSKAGDLGYTHGSYQMTFTDPASKKVIHDHGSYVTTYAKQSDGSWKAVMDIATSEVPPAAPEMAASK